MPKASDRFFENASAGSGDPQVIRWHLLMNRHPLMDSENRNRTLALICCVLLACIARAVSILHFDSLDDDQDAYIAIAQNLADGNGFCANEGQPTAFRPPLYPLVLAACLKLSGLKLVALLHTALGMLTTAWVWRLGKQLGFGTIKCTLASLLVAIDPILVRYSANPMTETLFTFLVVGLLNSMISPVSSATDSRKAIEDETTQTRFGREIKTGIWFGLAALCRPSIWAFAILWIGVSLAVRLRRNSTAKSAGRSISPASCTMFEAGWVNRSMICTAVTVLIVVSPWTLRNWWQFGRPILMTTHGGYTLALGNNPSFYESVVSKRYTEQWPGNELKQWQNQIEAGMDKKQIPKTDELARDAFHQSAALNWISTNPGQFLQACLIRQQRFWSPSPTDPSTSPAIKLGIGIFYSVQFLLVGISLFRSDLVKRYPAILVIIVSLALLHTFYWTNTRMRAPIEPFLALIAVTAFNGEKSQTNKRVTI
jgi:hypothetical protein